MTHPMLTSIVASSPDARDLGYLYTGHDVPFAYRPTLPTHLTRDQRALGACVAHGNAMGAARLAESGGESFDPSELFAHYKALELDGLLGQAPEGGVMPRTGMKVLYRFGLPTEQDWPYEEAKYNTDPGSLVHTRASLNRVGSYERIALDTLVPSLKQAISEGLMVAGAMAVKGHSLFNLQGPLETHASQWHDSDQWFGNHWMHFIGYDDGMSGGCFILAQSWGTNGPGRGDNGFIAIPYSRIRAFWEVWAIRSFKGHAVPKPVDALGEVGWQVLRLYYAMFRRAPDWQGLNYHVQDMHRGNSLHGVANNFTQAPEFAYRYGSLSNREFVRQLYLNVMDREPDPKGWDDHTGALDAGGLRGSTLVGFSESDEFRNKLKYFR